MKTIFQLDIEQFLTTSQILIGCESFTMIGRCLISLILIILLLTCTSKGDNEFWQNKACHHQSKSHQIIAKNI